MKLIPTVLATCLAITACLSLDVQAVTPPPAPPVTVDVKTGTTSLTLDPLFAGGLATLSVDIQKVAPGRIILKKGQLTFPISGGAFDLANAESEITHSGGISLSKDGVKVSVTDLVISLPDPGASALPKLSALVVVNGALQGRVNLFNLDLTESGVTAPVVLPKNGKIALKDVALKLSADGAAALNAAFGLPVFSANTEVGKAVINAITVKGSL